MKVTLPVAASLLVFSLMSPASAGPALGVQPAAALQANQAQAGDAKLIDVGWRHRWHGHGWRRHHPHHYGWGPAVGGLAAGAIVGSALANSHARASADAYCEQKYKSFDPASGTYLGYDGQRHPCP
jgi:hypothetical protein